MENRNPMAGGFAFTALAAIAVLASVGAARAAEVAKVNGQSVTDRDVRMALSSMNEGMRENVLKDPNTRREIVNALVEQEVLVDEAVKEKLDQDQEYKDAVAQFRKQFLSNRALQKNLGTKMTESAAKKYYEANKSQYSTDQVHAMHILVADEEKANEVLKLAKAKDADFQALAAKYSRDPSAKNNRGDIGTFGRSAPFDPAFMDAAFSGSAGEIVGPVKTSFGYHIIKVVDKKFGKPMTFDEVEMRVKQDLGRTLKDAYISKLKKEAKIQVNESAIDKI
jgi:parvulin-like peptidyl-prolyl isomerase